LENFLSKISISDVISSRILIKKKGREFEALCPFHHEKTPSFTISPQKGFYYCFGCGASGNAINFVMEFEKIPFREALEKIAKENGIILPDFKKKPQKEIDLEARRFEILKKIQQFFSQNLYHHQNISSLKYLENRSISNEEISEFQIGFAPDSFSSLLEFLQKNNFSQREILETTIVAKNSKGNLYSKFRNRIMFPICDKINRVIAFGGRRLNEEDNPKYLNSAETEIFKKSQNLYNQAIAKKSARDSDSIIVVEGYMDVIALAKNNIRNAVAPLGTAISVDQVRLLKNFADKIIFCLDGDNAGARAMKRVIDIILPILDEKKLFLFAFLPQKLDPDDFVKKYGRESMLDFLNRAKNLSEVLFELELRENGVDTASSTSPEIKAKLEKSLAEKTDKIVNFQIKKHFQNFYRDKLFFLGKKKFSSTGKGREKKVNQLYKISPDNQLVSFGKEIIFLLYKFPNLLFFKTELFSVENFSFDNEDLDNIKEYLLSKKFEESEIEYDVFIDNFKENALFSQIKPLLKCNVFYIEDVAKIRLEILILKIFLYNINNQFKNISNHIGNVEEFQQKQEGFFEYQSKIEHQIINLESQLI
jgi:DNA primase